MLADPRADGAGDPLRARSGCACRISRRSIPTRSRTRSSTSSSPTTMRRETELFFDSIVREDRERARSAHRRLHVRQRAARAALRHPGRQRARVPARDAIRTTNRRGLLGQGSILTLTSHANRTSPVLRGKWVMEVLLGIAAAAAAAERARSRRRPATAQGRPHAVGRASGWSSIAQNPAVPSCHRVMDPIGLALDNFDVTGAVAHPGERRAASTRAASSTTARRSTVRPSCARRCSSGRTSSLRTFTREPDGVRARPPRRVLRHADDPRDRARRRAGGISYSRSYILGDRDESRRVPHEHARRID